MMAEILSLPGYLVYIVSMMALSIQVLGFMSTFPFFINKVPGLIKLMIFIIVPFALKDFLWLPLISESQHTFPSNVSEMIALLLVLTGYLVGTVMGLVVMGIVTFSCNRALGPRPYKQLEGVIHMITFCASLVVMDKVTSYSSMVVNDMDPAFISEFLSSIQVLSLLVSLIGYLICIVCMAVVSTNLIGAMSAYLSFLKLPDFIEVTIAVIIPFTLKNFLWVVLISGPDYSLPSSIAEAITVLLCYLVCTIMGLVVLLIGFSVCRELPGQNRDVLPGWIYWTIYSVAFMAMDMCMSALL